MRTSLRSLVPAPLRRARLVGRAPLPVRQEAIADQEVGRDDSSPPVIVLRSEERIGMVAVRGLVAVNFVLALLLWAAGR